MKKLLLTVALSLFVAGGLLFAPTASAHFIGEQHMHDKKNPNEFWFMPQASQSDWEYHNWDHNNTHHHERFDQHTDYYKDNYGYKHKKHANNEQNTNRKIHYVENPVDYYNCDWEYDSRVGAWACEGYTHYSQPEYNCPYGYVRHENRNECIAIRTPTNAHLNANGDGWVCNSGYKMNYRKNGCERIKQDVYVYDAFSSDGLTYANNSTDNYRVYNAASSEYVYPYGASRLPTTGIGSGLLLLGSIFGGYKISRHKKNNTGR